ncbi:hypothetical protein ZWY2020_038957 [Hordeum vulgare]|nr:hypothetical protein ZWY2020_038957 [Hordeum vulgare]
MIDVPVRHANSDEDSDEEALPSVVVAAMENLSVLFSDLHLNDGPCYFGEAYDVEALYASFSRLFIAEMPAHDVYPSNVLIFDGPPPSVGFFTPYHVAAVPNAVEVMVIGVGTTTAPGKASAGAREPAAAAANTLRDAIAGLKTPVTASADPADARASLEEARNRILEEGIAVALAKRRLEATHREYNSTYGLTPISEAPNRLGSVRSRGRFIAEVLGGDLPTYETPAANMRAAQAAMEEMASLEGEERAFQEKRVKDLLDAANQQHAWFDPGQAQSESPGPNSGARRNPSGQHHAEGSSSHSPSRWRGEGSQDRRSQRQSEHTWAYVVEATRAIRSTGIFPRAELTPPAPEVPPLSPPGLEPPPPRMIGTLAVVSSPWPIQPSWRKTDPSVRHASAPGSKGNHSPEVSPCLGIRRNITVRPGQKTG